MSRKHTVPISKEQYDQIIGALGMTRAGIGQYLQVTKHALGWWRSQGRIPVEHLATLKYQLEQRLSNRKPTDVEQSALSTMQSLLDLAPVFAAEESVADMMTEEKGALDDLFSGRLNISESLREPRAKNLQLDLGSIDLQVLVEEIERRGWSVALTLKTKTTIG